MNPKVYQWPKSDPAAICAVQTVNLNAQGQGTLLLNGDLAPYGNTLGLVSLNGIARALSITTTTNESAYTLTINGLINGSFVSISLACPNTSTVYTSQWFEAVTSITVSGPALTTMSCSVGTGSIGRTSWYLCNWRSIASNLSIQVQVISGNIDWVPQITLVPVQGITDPPSFADGASSTTSGIITNIPNNILYLAIFILAGNPPPTDGSLTVYILQVGSETS